VISWFQSLPFKFNLHRYTGGVEPPPQEDGGLPARLERDRAVEVRVRERELKSEHAGAIPVTCALGALAHSLHEVLHGYWRGESNPFQAKA
jgi:hypothetical protein